MARRKRPRVVDKELRELLDGLPCCHPACNEEQYHDRLGPVGLCKKHYKISHRAICLPVSTAEPEYQISLPGYA